MTDEIQTVYGSLLLFLLLNIAQLSKQISKYESLFNYQNYLGITNNLLREEEKMQIFQIIVAAFSVLGSLDRITGNHLKLGQEFENGIMIIGSLALVMTGMTVLSPVISTCLIPIVKPISDFLHIDPSFVSGFLANDMGGAALAAQMSPNTVWSAFNGLVVSSMLGATICFTIPVPLKMIDQRHHEDILTGIMCGIGTIPIGCIAGGLTLGCSLAQLLRNLLPVIIISIATCVGFMKNATLCRKLFVVSADVILGVSSIGLALGIWEYLTGMVLIAGMGDIQDAFGAVAGIAITLSGVLPMIKVLSLVLHKPLNGIGKMLKINHTSVLGMIISLSNSIPMLSMVAKMDRRGIVINMAFAVSAAFVFGDHLAFTMAFNNTYLVGVIVGKLVGGLCAAFLASIVCRNYEQQPCN